LQPEGQGPKGSIPAIPTFVGQRSTRSDIGSISILARCDDLAAVELEVESDDRSFRGRAASTDIIEASALAYINAVNAIQTRKERGHVREVVGRPGAGA
jgi:2-isopropylmalate synthase